MKIKFENVCYQYNHQLLQQRQVLNNINLEVSEGEFIGLVGPTGSGKTTLLQHFTGLLQPTSGKIYIDEQDIWNKDYSQKELRRKIGLVFQFPESQLFDETVCADVAFGPKALNLSEEEIETRVAQALKLVGMKNDEIGNRSPYLLSEGEKRRVALAGVLAMAPEMLVLDEPTAGLDPSGTKLIINILKRLNDEGTTISLITHNMDVILQLAERIVVLNEGSICFDGDRKSLFAQNELLRNVNLEIPRVIRLGNYLYQSKIIADQQLYSISELKQKIELEKCR